MIHELREYTLDLVDSEPYFDLFRHVGMKIRGNEYGRLVGNWIVDDEHVKFIHIWEYQSLADRTHKRAALSQQTAWTNDFLAEAVKRVSTQNVSILNPVSGQLLDASYAADLNGRVLQQFRCRPGTAAGIAAALSAKCPRADGIWLGEFPDPNAVFLLTDAADEVADTDELDELGLLYTSTRRISPGPYR